MKAILVLDEMPNECMECELRYKDGDKDDWFRYRCHMSDDQVEKGKRLENCPLKPIPEKVPQAMIDTAEDKNMLPTACRYKGWNDCIDEILGGNDE